MKILKLLAFILCSIIVSLGIVTFVKAARSQYGYTGIYNATPFTLSSGDGSALSVDVNGYVQVSTSSALSSLRINSLGVNTSTPDAIFQVVNGTNTTTIIIGSSYNGTKPAINCMWNGVNFTKMSFPANSTTPTYTTSTSC